MAKGLEPCAAIDHGAFIQILGNVQKKGMQHPQGKGLVDRDQHDDRGRQMPPQVPFEKRQHVARDQRDMRHGAKHQRDHQQPEGIAKPRPRQSVAAQGAERQRNRDCCGHHDAGVQDVAPKPAFNPRPDIALPREGRAGLGNGHRPRQRIHPIGTRKEIALHLERAPEGPDKGKGGQYHPQHDKARGQDDKRP